MSPRKREYAVDPTTLNARNMYAYTLFEALQQAEPNQTINLAREDLLWIRSAVDTISKTMLLPAEQEIFRMVAIEQLSIRQAARYTSYKKSQVWNLYRSAIQKLRAALSVELARKMNRDQYSSLFGNKPPNTLFDN